MPNSARKASQTNWPVFIWGALGAIGVTVWALVTPEGAQQVLGSMVAWTASWFGWFYVALAAVVVVFVIYLALSRFGHVKLGPQDAQPEFTTLEWASMLFAAGIGTDLMFFAVAEPVTQYLHPPTGAPETVQAARQATVWTLFHYGLSGWAMYALMGMALAYFAYRKNLPLAVRSALAPIFGKRLHGRAGDAVDVAALLGTVFGVATSLGIGVVMVNVGLATVFGLPVTTGAQVAIVVVGVTVATLSAVSGVDRGIKFLSLLNVVLAVGLAGWVLLMGRTQFLLEALVLNVGDFIAMFPSMMMQTFAFEDTGTWMADWTLFFWAWWVAWASFVGLFLARISRGRTIRQFVLGTVTIPFVYVLMWISIYGNAALDVIRGGDRQFGLDTVLSPEGGFYELLSRYPGFTIVAAWATLTALLFYVTSADSAALVMANLSSRLPSARHDGRASLRVFWAVTTGALTIAMLLVGGIGALQDATVIMGLPFAFVLVLVMISLHRALLIEEGEDEMLQPFQDRIRRILAAPNVARAAQYRDEILIPTLQRVATELGAGGMQATSTRQAPGVVRLEVKPEGYPAFRYEVHQEEGVVPTYGTRPPGADDRFVRLEVHLNDAPQGYDVLGYSKRELLEDVFSKYEQHTAKCRLAANQGPGYPLGGDQTVS